MAVRRRVAALFLLALTGVIVAVAAVSRRSEAVLQAPASSCSASWRTVTSPALREGELTEVAGRTATDAWAVGRAGVSPLIEHWDGRRWRVVPSPRVRGRLSGLAILAADDVWAVGRTGHADNRLPHPERYWALIEHWDGFRWSRVEIGLRGTLGAAAAAGRTEIWAVGADASDIESLKPLLVHRDGHSWKAIADHTTGARAVSSWSDVAALAPDDVWVIGTGDREIAAHWNGTRWRRFRLPPSNGSAEVLAADTTDDVWAVGSEPTELMGSMAPDLWHWDGRTWQTSAPPVAPSPGGLHAAVTGTDGRLWVAGREERFGESTYAFARSDAGRWRRHAVPTGHYLDALARDPRGGLWGVGLSAPKGTELTPAAPWIARLVCPAACALRRGALSLRVPDAAAARSSHS